jgi:hypothetical protein
MARLSSGVMERLAEWLRCTAVCHFGLSRRECRKAVDTRPSTKRDAKVARSFLMGRQRSRCSPVPIELAEDGF